MNNRVLTVLLAGGKGTRLEPLTRDRAKPAVPFAGVYRIVDFALSNCLNSSINQILVLTQYKSLSLDRHITLGWTKFFHREFGYGLDIVPAQQRVSEDWYLGTADAVFQNLYSIERADVDDVLILAADHIYKMNYRHLISFHRSHGGPATVATLDVPVRESACQFGVVEVDSYRKITGFSEKPESPQPLPDSPDTCLASLGIYVFRTDELLKEMNKCHDRRSKCTDFGHHLLPEMIERAPVYAYSEDDRGFPDGIPYWRDVGTLDAYFDASMELLKDRPSLNLYDPSWPIFSWQPPLPASRIATRWNGPYDAKSDSSLVAPGCRIDGSITRSILGIRVEVDNHATVEDSVIFDRTRVGADSQIRRTILDKDVVVKPGASVGIDRDRDLLRGFTVSSAGVTCVPRNTIVTP
jgi:glucose-1-phosphate adenylyltransferase